MQTLTTYISIVYFIAMITMSACILRDYAVRAWWLLPPAFLAVWDFAMGFVLSPIYWALSAFTCFVCFMIWLVKHWQERTALGEIARSFWSQAFTPPEQPPTDPPSPPRSPDT